LGLHILSQAARAAIESEFKKYLDKRSALLPALWIAQGEVGYLPQAALLDVATLLDLSPVQVYDVATFYSMYHLQPVGTYHIQLCKTLSCALVGAEPILAHLKTRLGIDIDGITPDGLFSLACVECLAACGSGPTIQINDDYYEHLTPERIDQILDDLKRDGESPLASGPFCLPMMDVETSKTPKNELILFKNMQESGYDGLLCHYQQKGGYTAIAKVLGGISPEEVIETVKKSGLRGRGGAGFPTGTKWGFIPRHTPGPRYLCCNADESEPGTFKDRQLIERDPHQMIEGMIIASYALGVHTAYIYIRGEFILGAKILEKALGEAYQAGFLGKNILGSGFDLDIYVHRGAGAYICGEETALLESIEGKRGKPRTKPPFPAVHGLYQRPTVINNVETLSNIPHIILQGGEWYAAQGTGKSTGTRLFSISGHVKRPGNYEVPMGVTLREMIFEYAGGMRNDKKLKAIIPGGASAAFLTEAHLDVRMDFESIAAAGSMLGSGGVTVMDEETCMVGAAANLLEFFHHESCGKCTPCREGSSWILQILHRIETGSGAREDLDLLMTLSRRIEGMTVCAFGDAEIAPVLSTLKYFRGEYEAHMHEKGCPFRVNAEIALSRS